MSTESIAEAPSGQTLNKKGAREKNHHKIQKKKTPRVLETSEEWDVEMKLAETRLLLCKSILNQIKAVNSTEEAKSTKEEVIDTQVDNELPNSEDLNNDFKTDHINMAAMNVCGVKGKEKILQSIFHKNDIRVGVISETWLTGKEKPDLGRSFTSFISNRSEKVREEV